jgi:hypothetical protein
MAMRRCLSAAILALPVAASARAQAIRGLVVDSASRRPVPGVVVSLLDSNASVIGRIITNDRGQFNVPSASAIRRLRTQRIGFRLREHPVTVAASGFTDVEVRIATLPTLLEPIRVTANSRCPRRADGQASYALLEQARAGLLATVVARGDKPAVMRGLAYERYIGRDGERTDSQNVRIHSAFTKVSFAAARTPLDFLTAGFVRPARDGQEYFGPDAEVLLSDEFSSGYCFRVAEPVKARQGQAGLAFEPATRLRNGNAIAGTLWVDTVARALVDIEFRYLDLGRMAEMVRPGGRASFSEPRPGMALIDRWALRLPRYVADTSRDVHNANVVRAWSEPMETGAELAAIRWSDGQEWRGHFGTLRVFARDGDDPAIGVAFALDNTDYRGVTDPLGRLEITELLPGPYTLTATNAALADVGVSFSSSHRFVAARDSVVTATIEAPTLAAYAIKVCLTDRRARANADRRHLVAGLVVGPDGASVKDAEISAKLVAASNYFLSDVKASPSGRFDICVAEEMKLQPFTIVVRAPSFEDKLITVTAREVVTPLRITLSPRPK